MVKNPAFAVITGSVYLVFYCVCLNVETLQEAVWYLFAFYPFLLIWVVYTILRYGRYTGPELKEHEYGYEDIC